MATTRLGQIYEIRNKLHQAAENYQHVLSLMGEDPPPFATVAIIGLARIHMERNELDSAEKYAEQGFQLARLCDQVIDRLITSELVLCRLKLAQGDSVSAARFLSQAEQTALQNEFAVRLPDFAVHHVLINLYLGDTSAAVQIAQQINLPILQARTLIANGDPSAAMTLLMPYRQQVEEMRWEDERLKAMVLQAIAHHQLNEKDEARQVLADTLRLAEPGGFIRLFVEKGEPMRLLILDFRSWMEYQSGVRMHPLKGYVDKLLASFTSLAAVFVSPIKNPQSELIEPLSPRELEVLQLICQGLSNQEICERMFLALDTVKGHNRRIFEKLQVHRRTEAIATARNLNLF